MNRPMFLLFVEIWDKGERVAIKDVCHGVMTLTPLFSYRQNNGIGVYYDFSDPNQQPQKSIEYFNANPKNFSLAEKEFDERCEIIRNMMKTHDEKSLQLLFNNLVFVWPMITLANILGDDSRDNVIGVNEDVVERSRKIRERSDDIGHPAEEVLLTYIDKLLPSEYAYAKEFILLEEVLEKKFPSHIEIVTRQKEYIFHKGQLFSGESLSHYAERTNIKLLEDAVEDRQTIEGRAAYKGHVRGIARIVFERKDFEKVCEGDILVTPMTTPNFLSIVKKVVGFITDEGGITSHAAIVARELQKPCVIATKIATQVIHDGDFVEIQDSRIRILTRAVNTT